MLGSMQQDLLKVRINKGVHTIPENVAVPLALVHLKISVITDKIADKWYNIHGLIKSE